MNFLKLSDSIFVNTANILKFEITSDSISVYLVGNLKPIALVSENPKAAAQWTEWLTTNTVNLVEKKSK